MNEQEPKYLKNLQCFAAVTAILERKLITLSKFGMNYPSMPVYFLGGVGGDINPVETKHNAWVIALHCEKISI